MYQRTEMEVSMNAEQEIKHQKIWNEKEGVNGVRNKNGSIGKLGKNRR